MAVAQDLHPVHYLYVFVVGAAIGFLSLTGIASSYARMLLKVSRYNELRTEKEQLKDRYSRLEEVAKERDVQVASLGSIASEVSALLRIEVAAHAGHSVATANPGRRRFFFVGPAWRPAHFRSHRRRHGGYQPGPDSHATTPTGSAPTRAQPLAG